jgi:nucleotide-binding universal stress UspA family protein
MLRVTRFARCDKIVVGVTHRSGARSALRWAIRAALPNDALVVAVTAFNVPFPVLTMFGWAYFNSGDAEAAARFMQGNVLEDELSGVRSSLRLRRLVVPDDPVQALVAAATDADLLVVGRQTRRIRCVVAPSVSKSCANQADCPVVIVRDDARASSAVPFTLDRLESPAYAAGPQATMEGAARNEIHHVRRHARFERRRR